MDYEAVMDARAAARRERDEAISRAAHEARLLVCFIEGASLDQTTPIPLHVLPSLFGRIDRIAAALESLVEASA